MDEPYLRIGAREATGRRVARAPPRVRAPRPAPAPPIGRRLSALHVRRRAARPRDASPSQSRRVRAQAARLALAEMLEGETVSSLVLPLSRERGGPRSTRRTGSPRRPDRYSALTIETVLRDVLLPYLHELGERWERGEISVAQEHFCEQRSSRAIARPRRADGATALVRQRCSPARRASSTTSAHRVRAGRPGSLCHLSRPRIPRSEESARPSPRCIRTARDLRDSGRRLRAAKAELAELALGSGRPRRRWRFGGTGAGDQGDAPRGRPRHRGGENRGGATRD